MSHILIIEVFISDKRVGRMARTPERLCGFKYDADWIQSGFSISPFYLPLKPGLIMAKRDPFAGNLGMFGDSLPDGWGNLLLDRYFGVERFDRAPQGKIHTASAAGLLNANYRISSLDYSLLLKLTLNLIKDIEQVVEMFWLMVFNTLISNRDDHAQNFSFQWINGVWKLSPAYDLLSSSGFNGYHTTTINGKGEPALADIIAVATEIGLSKQSVTQITEELAEKCAVKKMTKFKLR